MKHKHNTHTYTHSHNNEQDGLRGSREEIEYWHIQWWFTW